MGRRDQVFLTIAQGAGLGHLPKAPGTWGTAGGLVLVALLAASSNLWFFFGTSVILTALAVPICQIAADLLKCPDPSSVVLDELVATPFAYSGLYVGLLAQPDPDLPTLFERLSLALTIFAIFRVLDIWKPFGIHKLQRLPGGWGIVLDDLAAAVATAAITFPWVASWGLRFGT